MESDPARDPKRFTGPPNAATATTTTTAPDQPARRHHDPPGPSRPEQHRRRSRRRRIRQPPNFYRREVRLARRQAAQHRHRRRAHPHGRRLYSPTLGQFMSIDPAPGGNDKAYVYPADPVNMLDLASRAGCSWRKPWQCGRQALGNRWIRGVAVAGLVGTACALIQCPALVWASRLVPLQAMATTASTGCEDRAGGRLPPIRFRCDFSASLTRRWCVAAGHVGHREAR